MLEDWDPLVVLLIKAIGWLLLLTAFGAILFSIIKHAVCAGIKLAAQDIPGLTRDREGE
ncbi:hypothetical protein [Actinoplanes couchii]|nr:hypothetical protein [Actinoplanes couchii]MDR6321537.1 hypothetical protein [Actinoplanes couchii]